MLTFYQLVGRRHKSFKFFAMCKINGDPVFTFISISWLELFKSVFPVIQGTWDSQFSIWALPHLIEHNSFVAPLRVQHTCDGDNNSVMVNARAPRSSMDKFAYGKDFHRMEVDYKLPFDSMPPSCTSMFNQYMISTHILS